MKRFVPLAGLALMSALLAPGIGLADQPGQEGKRHGFHQRFQQELGLTDDQMSAIRQIRERQQATTRQAWQAVAKARGEVQALALSGADDATIQAKITELEGLYGQTLQLRVNTLREMAPLLSEEQRQKLGQMQLAPRPWGRHPGSAPRS
jgi:Spy/CpxP family protein refolding chaperone